MRTVQRVVAAVLAPPKGLTSRFLDVAVVPVRVALAWIFIYYGAGKLFGAFNGPGIHRTALFMSNTAHLHPGGFFAVLGGVTEFGGGIAMALGLFTRAAGLALIGDQVMAMITVTWVNGINSLTTKAGYEFNLALVALAVVVLVLGAGRVSADYALWRRLDARAAVRASQPASAPGNPSSLADRVGQTVG